MKRFTFRLETVLRQREILEEGCEQAFAKAQGQVDYLRARQAVLQDEIQVVMAGRPGGGAGESFDAADALNRERYLATLQHGVGLVEQYLAAARIAAEETRLDLVAARQAREAVEKLRKNELRDYMALSLKMEQETLDEQAGLRHGRARAMAATAERKEAA